MHNNKTPPPAVAAPAVPDKTPPQARPREAQPRELIAAVADIDRHTLWSTLRLRCALVRST